MKLPLTVACWDYDRTRQLFDGQVAIEGCETNMLCLPVEETFFRALRSTEFDVAELSLSSYTMMRSRGTCLYTAVPVFLSRMFRHSAIYVRADSPLRTPEDMRGKTVGVPEYQLTAPVWVRGILQDEYGVLPHEIKWRSGGVETPGRHEKVGFTAPNGVELESIPSTDTLDQHLLDGRIDALIAPRAPGSFTNGQSVRLFKNLRETERAYFAKTRIFPIMHVVGIRTALIEQHPWLAGSVFKAFNQAKNHALRELSEVGALKTSLPWLTSEYEDSVAAMGRDFWQYGVQPNNLAIAAFLRYHHQQGLSSRLMQARELFAPSTEEQFVI